MSILKLSLTALALSFSYLSFSQAICGFDPIHHKKMKEDPVYRQQMINYENNLRKYIQQNNLSPSKEKQKILSGPPYTIPVVVHVVHTGGAVGTIYNPTDVQIQGVINYLNQVYDGTYPGTVGAGDLQIQFVLAQRDPNCNPTNGINRIDGSGIANYISGGVNVKTTVGTDEINVKNLIRWDPTQYYNIWVVDKIDGNDGTSGTFIAGFAYLPGGNPNYDGTIILATQMQSGQKTLPHELGHAFSLYHPFENPSDPSGTTCASNTDCTVDGDQVCDTDPITEPVGFVCRAGTNPCTSTPYSINTEDNYMNYTNCNTLFTAGQKTRMLASAASVNRLSLSNSLGGTPPNSGSTTCIPKIDFELDNSQVTETTAGSSGCRAYKDYSYNMVIGNNPSITATATLSVVSGTATEGLDFDITTNGSFASPSKTLTFPAGSNSSQSFTIRIYDDASVENTETFTLGFIVNSGGGNAVMGDGRTNLTITIYDNDAAPLAGTTTGTVNIGTAAFGYVVTPFDATQQSQRVQFLYKASELTAAGVPAGSLSGIALDIASKLSTRSFTNMNISLGTATVNYLVNGSVTLGSSMTVVKTLASYNTTAGWINFTFDTPYTWDGTSNLVVEICYDNGTASASDAGDLVAFYSDGGTNSQGNLFFQDGVNCSQSFSSVTYAPFGRKPIIKLTYGIPGTVVETTLNSSQQQYLGANSDIYFYDQSNNQLMARIQNQSAFDYGCTQVILDRAGTNATQFWNNNTANYLMDKTFRVLPTNNNPSGSYIITLYYTQAEINGWQTTTGQSLGNIQLVKTTGQISSVTPLNPTGGGTVVIGTPAISTLGTNTGLSYNFTTGFSGFGAGVVGVALPISLLDFEGRLGNKNVLLNWSTASEENSKGFEIERSYDAVHFGKIGYVEAVGNSSSPKNYSFIDPDIAQENNYYQLKQIDLDNKFVLSKIILVKGLFANVFKILNNPFTNYIDIQFGEQVTGKTQIRLLDITGRELLRKTWEASGLSTLRIDLSQKNIVAGVYLLEVTFNNNQKHVERVVRQ